MRSNFSLQFHDPSRCQLDRNLGKTVVVISSKEGQEKDIYSLLVVHVPLYGYN